MIYAILSAFGRLNDHERMCLKYSRRDHNLLHYTVDRTGHERSRQRVAPGCISFPAVGML
eukprot:COSAG02_NODE_4243_length_5593_cov_32.867674_10_plen_60_part_00